MATRTTTPAEDTPGQKIKKLQKGEWVNLGDVEPDGSLSARRLASSVKFYWRFTHAGKTSREEIGIYDSSAPPKSTEPTAKGYSVEAARRAAQTMAAKHRHAIKDGGHAALKAAAAQAAADAESEARRASEFTLAHLLDAYCDYREKLGRKDINDARGIFKLHIKEPFPEIAAKPAAACTRSDFVLMMRRLQEAGKKRTSNKLRAYAGAAFEVARTADSKPEIPEHFLDYRVEHNPASETGVDPSGNRTDKNPLTMAELRLYWSLIKDLPGLRGGVLRLHLLCGGQRIAQLVRAKTEEMHDGIMLLWDDKGPKPDEPREHPIPITAPVQLAINACQPTKTYVMSSDRGKTHVHPTTVTDWAQEVVGERITAFEPKRVRSTVKTVLARAGVPEEARNRLQSHDIAGLANAHYNAYNYVDEKREAMDVLYRWLTTPPPPQESVDFGDEDLI